MGKETIAEIPKGSGNFYRYEYADGQMVYRGPMGSAPEISETEFLKTMSRRKVVERWDRDTYTNKLNKWDFMVKEEIRNERTFEDWDTGKEYTVVADYILWDPEQDEPDGEGSHVFIYGTIIDSEGNQKKGKVGLLTMHSIRDDEYPTAESILFDDWGSFAPVVLEE
jgi:hypothetical protein